MKSKNYPLFLTIIFVVLVVYDVARAIAQYWNGTTTGMIFHGVFALIFLGLAIKSFVTWHKIKDLDDDEE